MLRPWLKGHQPGAQPVIDPAKGYWPPWQQKFLNDFRSEDKAKANDGLVPPTYPQPEWATHKHAGTDLVLDVARRRHSQAEERGEVAEQRAERLLRTALALLTLALTVTGFQLQRLRAADAAILLWAVVLLVAMAAIVCLALAAVQASGVDRVGYSKPIEPSVITSIEPDKQQASLAAAEAVAARTVNWSAKKKVNEFLQARAWLTRGITALAASGAMAMCIWVWVDDAPTCPEQASCHAAEDAGE